MHLPAFVAQWIEQEPSNLLVAGSIPAEGALAIVDCEVLEICLATSPRGSTQEAIR